MSTDDDLFMVDEEAAEAEAEAEGEARALAVLILTPGAAPADEVRRMLVGNRFGGARDGDRGERS